MSRHIHHIPKDLRDLRACLVCSLIKTTNMFYEKGCDNCEDILKMKGSAQTVEECTSSNFDGMIALMQPEESWVAKWQRINTFVKGMYAISVTGTLTKSTLDTLEINGYRYRNRDVSLKT